MITALKNPPKPTWPSLKSNPNNFLGSWMAWLAVIISPRVFSKFKVLSNFFLFKAANLSLNTPAFFSSGLNDLAYLFNACSSRLVSYIDKITSARVKIKPKSQKVAALFPAFSLSTPSRNLTLAKIWMLSNTQ